MNISDEKIIYCKKVDGLFYILGEKMDLPKKKVSKITNNYSEIYDTMK